MKAGWRDGGGGVGVRLGEGGEGGVRLDRAHRRLAGRDITRARLECPAESLEVHPSTPTKLVSPAGHVNVIRQRLELLVRALFVGLARRLGRGLPGHCD